MSNFRWQEIEALYFAALERPSELREEFLRHASYGNEELRRQVEELLAQDIASSPLDQPLYDSHEHRPDERFEKGSMLGPFRLEEPIGSGGMGSVYRATDTRLGRAVAIKAGKQEFRRRFDYEAKAISSLNHPHICTLYDTGPGYLVMELVEGETLATILTRGPLSVEDTLRYGAQIANALAAAHAKGIIHRDLKPANIMITNAGVKILDFGLARIAVPDQSLTLGHAMMGTPLYMAPEQVEGKSADERTDLFALGLLLYEMLAGRVPFPGASLGSMLMHGSVTIPPPSKVRPGIPSKLNSLVGRLLTADPAARPASATGVCEDLSALSSARREPSGIRGPFSWIAAVAVLAVVVVACGWLVRSRSRVEPAHSLVVLPLLNLTGDANNDYVGDSLTQQIIQRLAGVPGLKVTPRSTSFRFRGKSQDIRAIGEQVGADVVLKGTLASDHGQIRLTADLTRAKDGYQFWTRTWDVKNVLVVQEAISQTILQSLTARPELLPITRRPTTNQEAYHLYLQGQLFREKIFGGSLQKAIGLFEQAIALDPSFAMAQAALADCYAGLGYSGQWPPKSAYPKAQQAVRKALQLDNSLSYGHAVQGFIYLFFDWNWPLAERELREAIALDPSETMAHHYYSYYLASTAQFPESLDQTWAALNLDPLNARLLGHLVWNQLWARNLPEALAAGRRLEELYPEIGQCCRTYVAWTYEQDGNFQKAIAEWQEIGISPEEAAGLRKAIRQGGPAGYWGEWLRGELVWSADYRHYVSPYFVAKFCARLKNPDQAFEWLDKAVQERDSWLAYLNTDPSMDNLRGDPRFAALVRKIGIPAAQVALR